MKRKRTNRTTTTPARIAVIGLDGVIRFTSKVKPGETVIELAAPSPDGKNKTSDKNISKKTFSSDIVSRVQVGQSEGEKQPKGGDSPLEAVVRGLMEYHLMPVLEAIKKESVIKPSEDEILTAQLEKQRQRVFERYLA